MVAPLIVSVLLSAQCLGDSWTSTLEASTWPFLTMRMRSLRVRLITSVDSGPTTFYTQVSPESHLVQLLDLCMLL